MHTWLPDAHVRSADPGERDPLRDTATVAVWTPSSRRTSVSTGEKADGGPLGSLSVGVAGVFLLVQRDYKRLFAYLSIEHIGIAVHLVRHWQGPVSLPGAWHLLNHALAKSTAFDAAGLVLLRYQHRMLDRVPGLLRQMPLTGVAVLVAGLALAGMFHLGCSSSEVRISPSERIPREPRWPTPFWHYWSSPSPDGAGSASGDKGPPWASEISSLCPLPSGPQPQRRV